MVKTNITNSHARIIRGHVNTLINDIAGKYLTRRRTTRTVNEFGELTATSTADTSFRGLLQKSVDVDEKLIEVGFIEQGDAVLFVHPTELSSVVALQDLIINGTTTGTTYDAWEVVNQLNPEVGGTIVYYSYALKRRDDVTL